jgi:hypothetical protein
MTKTLPVIGHEDTADVPPGKFTRHGRLPPEEGKPYQPAATGSSVSSSLGDA